MPAPRGACRRLAGTCAPSGRYTFCRAVSNTDGIRNVNRARGYSGGPGTEFAVFPGSFPTGVGMAGCGHVRMPPAIPPEPGRGLPRCMAVTWSEHGPTVRRRWPRPAGSPPFARAVRPDPPPARLDGPRPAAYGACSVMLGGIFGVGPTPPDAGQCRPAQAPRRSDAAPVPNGPKWPEVLGLADRPEVARLLPASLLSHVSCRRDVPVSDRTGHSGLCPVRAIGPRNGSGATGTVPGRRTPSVHQIFPPFLDARPVLWNMRRRTRPFFRKEHI